MAYDWAQAAEGEKGAYPDRIPPGDHEVTIARVVLEGKNGPFKSKAGDPQIMVVFQDKEGNESSDYLTLSKKAGWTLARLLSRAGVDLKPLTDVGLEPTAFTDKETAESHLLGKTLWVRITPSERGRDDILPIKATEAKPAKKGKAKAKPAADDNDDIPF